MNSTIMWLFGGIVLLLRPVDGVSMDISRSGKEPISYPQQLSNFLALAADFFSGMFDIDGLNNPDEIVTDEIKQQIDEQIEHYLYIVKKAHGLLETANNGENAKTRNRRALPKDQEQFRYVTADYPENYNLKGFKDVFVVPSRFPTDICIFPLKTSNSYGGNIEWYAAALEMESYHGSNRANQIVLYKFQDESFIETFRAGVSHARLLETFDVNGKTFLVAAEYRNENTHQYFATDGMTIIYQVTSIGGLMHVQSLQSGYQSDVVFWEDTQGIHLVIANEFINTSGTVSVVTKTPIYRWLGGHFDVVSNIVTYNPKRIIHFTIGACSYLAVANHQNNFGDTAIFSEVFKYNIHQDKFLSYQKLATRAATDIKHFCIKTAHGEDHFLVVANQYERDIDGVVVDYRTTSTVYKFSEDYFVPFQSFVLFGASEWLPLQGTKGEFILLVNCLNEGVKAFQYDGWMFFESPTQFGGASLGRGVLSMRSYLYENNAMLVVANRYNYGDSTNVFSPVFTAVNEISSTQNELLEWCESSLQELYSNNIAGVMEEVSNAPKLTSPAVFVNGKLEFLNADIKHINTSVIRTDDVVIDNTNVQNINSLDSGIKMQKEIIDNLEKEVEQLLRSISEENNFPAIQKVTDHPVEEADEKIETGKIKSNNEEVISEDSREIEINELTITGTLITNMVNGHNIEDLVYKNQDASLTNLDVIGDLYIANELTVDGLINNIKFTSNNIVLNNQDQILDGNLDAKYMKIEKFSSTRINNNELYKKTENKDFNYTTIEVDNLKVNAVNGLHFNVIFDNALRIVGDQIIASDCVIEDLVADQLDSETISNVEFADIIQITNGSYYINQDLVFIKPLYIKTFHVLDRINSIRSINGNLQILRKNLTSMQYIGGEKWFENVNLLGPLTLLGKIESKSLDLQNPVNMIDKDLELYGDYFLTGNSTIRKLVAKDLSIRNISISTVQQHGLKLDENIVPNNIVFNKSFLSSQLTCPQINSLNTSTWVSCCSINHQIVFATKQFDGNLEIDGLCDVLGSINKINIKELDENILKISGDQVLEGKIYFEDVYTEKTVSNKTTIADVSLEQFLTKSSDQEIYGDVVVDDLVSVYTRLSAEVVHQDNFEGTIGTLENMFYDTALNNGKRYNITGEKYFNNLNIENLYIKGLLGGLDFDAIKRNMLQSNADIHFKEFIDFPNNVTINKLDFVGSLDSISHEDFGTSWLLVETDQTIHSSIEFLNLKCHEPLDIYTGIVNTKNFSTLLEDIVWTNKEEALGNITFVDGLISVTPVSAGTVSGIRFSDEVVQSKQVDIQYISDNAHVIGNLNVHGQLTVQNIGNVSLEQLENYVFTAPIEYPPNLIIKGSATFEEEPIINFLNWHNITEILDVAWLSNEDTRLSGSIEFSNLYLDKEVTVHGAINGVDLKSISENYFSLTKDQNISSSLQFVGGVKFNNKIIAEEAEVAGLISGINLQEFVSNRLNDDSDQIISGDFWFEEILVSGDHNSGTVNSYNFSTSFLRYDVPENYVTGDKIFDELSIRNISVNPMQNIQNVNIDQWFKDSVLVSGDYLVHGVKTINDPTMLSDLRFSGSIDGVTIALDTVMLTYGDQTITGKKTFNRQLLDNEEKFAAHFSALYVHGQLNKVHVNELMNNIVSKDAEIVLQGAINFTEMLVVENKAEINGLLFGVNISELINGVANAENFNKYEDEYQDLYENGLIISESLKSPAYYLSHYEIMQNIEGSVVLCPFIIESNIDNDEIGVLARMDRNNHLSFMTWNNISEEFIQNPEGKERMAHSDIENISVIKSLTIQGKNHLYVETFLEPHKARAKNSEYLNNTYLARIYKPLTTEMNNTLSSDSIIPTHKLTYTRSSENRFSIHLQTILSFNVYERQCLFVMDALESMVYCTNGTDRDFIKEQLVKTQGAVMAVSLEIEQVTYIMVLVDDSKQSGVIVYKCGKERYITRHGVIMSVRCEPKQVLHTKNPRGLSAVSHQGQHFLVTSAGYAQNAMHHGKLHIYKYDAQNMFTLWQPIIATAPSVVAFAVLPTQELVLYALSESRTETFNVYIYRGVAGFVKQITTSTIPKGIGLTTISMHYRHFVIISTESNTAVIIEAKIKGEPNET